MLLDLQEINSYPKNGERIWTCPLRLGSKWYFIDTKEWDFSVSLWLRENGVPRQWPMAPWKTHKRYNTVSSYCWVCNRDKRDFNHIWWSWGRAELFLQMVIKSLNSIQNVAFPVKPLIRLLNTTDDSVERESYDLTLYTLTAAWLVFGQYCNSAIRSFLNGRWPASQGLMKMVKLTVTWSSKLSGLLLSVLHIFTSVKYFDITSYS